MELGGPMAGSKLQKYIPGPGKYSSDHINNRSIPIILKSRLPDTSMEAKKVVIHVFK